MRKWSMVVAMSEDGVIGYAGTLPWRLPEDLRRFKQMTMGKPILMGRKTWDSIGRALPGRQNVVLTRDKTAAFPGAQAVVTLDAVEEIVPPGDEIMVIGGAEIYRLCLPRTDRIYLTRVHAEVHGDTWFPELDWDMWTMVREENWPADERHAQAMTFEVWEKKAKKD